MNTHGVDGTPVGGGEILQYWNNPDMYNTDSPYLDNDLIRTFHTIPFVKLLICILILGIMGLLILRLFNIKSPFKAKGITRELEYMERIQQRDMNILRANRFMSWVSSIVRLTPFTLTKTSLEYWQYNLNRAGIKIPGGSRTIKAEEFNAIVVFIAMCAVVADLLAVLFVNSLLGWLLLITTIIVAATGPMMVVRSTVAGKDDEIKANFSDYYLMIHYTLIAGSNTPLSGVMRSYAKTTSSKEMQKYIDSCIHYIDTYGEYEATRYIAKDYREIPEVGKLMRLIRQANEGGEVKEELMGFREELLKAKKYVIEKNMEKLIARAMASFNLLMIVLVQAVLSAMAIYVGDLGLASTIIGI